MREPSDDRCDQIRAHRRVLRNVETFGHARHRAGQDDVALDVLACAFERDDVVEADDAGIRYRIRSEEHTSELQSLMRISYARFCLKKKKTKKHHINRNTQIDKH